jgi:acetyl esterase/lipase
MYGDLGNLAPTDIHVGTHDLLYPDVVRFHERATAAGSEVRLHTCPSGLHIYPLTPTPEGRAATRDIIASLQPAA